MSVAESESLLRQASHASAASRGAVELDDTQRHQKVTQWSGLLIAIDMIAIVCPIAFFFFRFSFFSRSLSSSALI
jgi:hypothetical protein